MLNRKENFNVTRFLDATSFVDENMVCPECHMSEVEEYTRSNRHGNGKWNETIRFKCGFTVKYSPNSCKMIVTSVCRNSKKFLESRIIRENLKEKLVKDLIIASKKNSIGMEDSKSIIESMSYITESEFKELFDSVNVSEKEKTNG